MYTRLLMLCCFFSLSYTSSLTAQAYKYATAQIIQHNGSGPININVVYETGETETIELKSRDSKKSRNLNSQEERQERQKAIAKSRLDQQVAITAFINDMAKKGYHLHSLEYTLSHHDARHTMMVFRISK